MASSIKDPEVDRLARELAAIRRRCADLPVLDTRAGDVVIGFDRHGLPT
jgi:antitoxin VapB